MFINDLQIVLVRPRNPLNIGAVARAMANFGYKKLAVVNPYAPIWQETKSAVGAEAVIKKAKKFDHLYDAIKKSQLVIGTSAGQRRQKNQKWIEPLGLKALVKQKKLKSVSLVFGSEKTGLSNDDLNFCHAVLKIPTAEKCPSMNLSQAVAVTCYIFDQLKKTTKKKNHLEEVMPVSVLERLVEQSTKACEEAGLFPHWEGDGRKKHIRDAIYRWSLNKKDVSLLHGLFRWIMRKSRSCPASLSATPRHPSGLRRASRRSHTNR